jgi:UDP-N-acetylglucosamine:LPS N-acetylglucosamine transferase
LKVLAVSSGGGHWVQLQRLMPAFQGAAITYVSDDPGCRQEVPGAPLHLVNAASRWNKAACLVMAARILLIVLRVRPDLVISTGAAPGYCAIRFARLLGARTIWVDSIANVEEMSMAGRMVARHADLWLTQWSHLARPGGPECWGAVL